MKNKIQPQAPDLEKAVLGACMLETEAFLTASEIISYEMFYSTANSAIWTAMSELSAVGQPIDILTVIEQLKKLGALAGVGGEYYVTSLTNSVVSSANVLNHSQVIVQKYLLRELIKAGAEIYKNGYEDSADPFEIMETTEKLLHQLSQSIHTKDYIHINETLVSITKDLEEKRHRDKFLTGVPTGFTELDKATCGWQPSDLVVLAARPKCGKTAFALNLALNAALDGEGVGFFSMEMSAPQLVKRILSNRASMYLQSLRDARLDDTQMQYLFENGIKRVAGIPFYIDDTPSLSVADFKSKARKMVKKQKVKLLFVDYLQLMQGRKDKKGQNREQEVSGIARDLKIAAKELNVPILALSQLSRAIEQRGSNIPQLSDLRESGAIEQDADMVMFLYKPDAEDQRKITLKIAAYRNGDVGSYDFQFDGAYQRFTETKHEKQFKPVVYERSFPGVRQHEENPF